MKINPIQGELANGSMMGSKIIHASDVNGNLGHVNKVQIPLSARICGAHSLSPNYEHRYKQKILPININLNTQSILKCYKL